MTPALAVTHHQGIACFALNYPPVNTLDLPVRTALRDALDDALQDPAVQAVLIHGQGRVFCGGANLAAFDTDGLAEPTLHCTLRQMIESAQKPVIAATHGAALGGGLELALMCHYRVWQRGAKLALPEITLGFMPGAGGTQLLPRAVGLESAINLILTGRTVAAETLADTVLVDTLLDADADLLTEALQFARAHAAQRPLPRLCDRRVEDDDAPALLQFARRNFGRGRRAHPGSLAALDAIAASTDGTPYETALQREFTVFYDLTHRPEARALRYQFLAKRQAAKPADPALADAEARPLHRAAVIGAGLMGTGIAFCLARAGLQVHLTDRDPNAQARADTSLERELSRLQKNGQLDEAGAQALRARIRWTEGESTLEGVDLALEAVVENYAIKAEVLRWLDQHAPAHALLASNTSTLDLNALAQETQRPQAVIGMHFFSPAPIMPLVELVRTRFVDASGIATALALCARLKKTPVIAGVCDGFIGNRLIERYTEQAIDLVVAGVSPERIDRALERFGMAMGPLRMLDMVGNDIPWSARRERYARQPDAPDSLADWLCERGWFGQKTGRGWYRHEPAQKRPQANPELPALAAEYAAARGIEPLAVSDDDIVQRCCLALINEGAHVVAEGVAQRASDIDVVYVAGYGFPATRGGPMFQADAWGLVNVLARMRRFQRESPRYAHFWEPAPLLTQCLHQGTPLHQTHARSLA